MFLSLAKRLIYALAVVFTVASLVFVAVHSSGDPLAGFVPPGSSPERAQRIRHEFGLDRTVTTQYRLFVGRLFRADFGESWRSRQPALTTVLDRAPASLRLAAAALGLSLLVGIPLGALAAWRSGSVLDVGAMSVALLGQAVPGFFLGTLLILLFAVHLRWLPSSGGSGMRSLILPAVTLAAYPASLFARLIRSSLIETLHQDFIRTARGKGISEGSVVARHALRPAALPAIAFAGTQIGFLIGGAVVVEGVFAYPGVGQLALGAVADRDLPVIEAFVVLVAIVIVLANMAVDVIAGWIDPRVRPQSMRTAR